MKEKLVCPRCELPLATKNQANGMVWKCKNCSGISVGVGLLQNISRRDDVLAVWAQMQADTSIGEALCPSCLVAMRMIRTSAKLGSIEIDACSTCFLIWFDHSEIEKLPKADPQAWPKLSAPIVDKYRSLLTSPIPPSQRENTLLLNSMPGLNFLFDVAGYPTWLRLRPYQLFFYRLIRLIENW